jgi:hypothetical protein
MSASLVPIVLIFGAGANIGSHIARTFAAKGYKVALSSRSIRNDDSTTNFLNVRGDMSDPNSVDDVFTKVRETLGQPSVVVYNGQSSQPAPCCRPIPCLTKHDSRCKYFQQCERPPFAANRGFQSRPCHKHHQRPGCRASGRHRLPNFT